MAPPQVACRIDAHFYIGGVPCLVVRLSELQRRLQQAGENIGTGGMIWKIATH
ncbi:hypothetical protein PoMZ_09798 [Pyricularia oryzae]|uniref:Uncharacterized protein n=1 Tax=Pyricularia oryzae TaxID=318829 RepID=A0A4P7MVE3_PYROR|nr:hypothetical protein PoMZ_09798 [Pyricularia oryzae]